MKNFLILALLAVQIGLPLSYYLGDTPYDERFAWRMFSPVRLIKCQVQLTDATDGYDAKLSPFKTMHVVWYNLMKRARVGVVDAFAKSWCAEQKEAGRTPVLHVSMTCGPPDGRMVGICRGAQDRDGDGIPDGYKDAPGCDGEPAECFKADCGDDSAQTCFQKRCRVEVIKPDVNHCEVP